MRKLHLFLFILIVLTGITLFIYPKEILIIENESITVCLCTGFLKELSNSEKICYGIKSDCIIVEQERYFSSLEPNTCSVFNCSQVEDYLNTLQLKDNLDEISKKNGWLVLVIDNSGSMYGGKLQHTQDAAIKLINDLNVGDYAAVIEFHDSAKVVHNFSSNKTSLMMKIKSIAPKGKTKYIPALDLAFTLFNELGFNNIDKKIIFLSDGSPDDSVDLITDKVKQITQNNISLYTISIGSNGNGYNTSGDADQEKILKKMASYNDKGELGTTSFSITDIEELYKTFHKIYKEKRATQGNIMLEGEIDKHTMFTDEVLEIRSMAMSMNNQNIIPGYEIRDGEIICAPNINIAAEIINSENDVMQTIDIQYDKDLETYMGLVKDLPVGYHRILLRAALKFENGEECRFETEKFIDSINVSSRPPKEACNVECNSTLNALLSNKEFSVIPKNSKTPVDITMLIDNSGSMEGDLIETTKDITKTLIKMMTDNDQMSIITFSETPDLALQFSDNKELLAETVDSIFIGSAGTLYHPAFNKAFYNFKHSRNNGIKRVLIFFSDGKPWDKVSSQTILNKTNELVGSGICIYTIGLGPDSLRQTEAQDLLKNIALQSQEQLDCGGFMFPSRTEDSLAPILDMVYTEIIKGENDLSLDIVHGDYIVGETVYLDFNIFSNYNRKTLDICPPDVAYKIENQEGIVQQGEIVYHDTRHYHQEIRDLMKGNYTVRFDMETCGLQGSKEINLSVTEDTFNAIDRTPNKAITVILGIAIVSVLIIGIFLIRRLRI